MGGLVRHGVLVIVSMYVYHGFVLSAPDSVDVVVRDSQGPTTIAQSRAESGAVDDFRRDVGRVVSRQRQAMLFWVVVVGGAGLGAIIVLSVLTVLVHRTRRRSLTVDMRHKHLGTNGVSGPGQQKPLADQHKNTATVNLGRNYTNVVALAPPSTRVADSVVSWGSEFDIAGDLTENIYSNDYKNASRDDGKKDGTKMGRL